MINKIGILTSGGDAPGMNAAIRAVVRTAIHQNIEVIGIQRGYEGIFERKFISMDLPSVGDIIQRGGTALQTARCKRFMTLEGQQEAAEILREQGIEHLVVCGGDGSFRGAMKLEEQGIGVIGIPCTIDNDMEYTDQTIGFDTALNTVLTAIGNIRDTASSHNRVSIIEVMGRDCGDIAIYAGIAGGADAIMIPEAEVDINAICEKIKKGLARGKTHTIILKAEGVPIPINELAAVIHYNTGQEVRYAVLAYIQRGGSPTARDRILAAEMGNRAVRLLAEDKSGLALGADGARITETPLEEAVRPARRTVDLEKLALIHTLSI